MKAVAGFTLIAAVAASETASYWGDLPVDPTTTTTTTAASSTWEDVSETTTTTKPVDPSTWEDVSETSTTVDPTWEDASVTVTETLVHSWEDVTVTETVTLPVDPTAVSTWADVPVADETTSTVWADASAAPVDPASTWVDAAICKVVTVTQTGHYIWVPEPAPTSVDPTWSEVVIDTTTTSADPTWSDVVIDTTTTTTSADPTWSDYTVAPTTTTSPDPTWSDYTVAPTTTTTKAYTYTTLSTKTTTTTTAAPKPTGATCPNDNGKTLPAEGSCGSSYKINCGVKATPGATTKFWQKTKGEKVPTLAACVAICNENALCTSVLYVATEGSADSLLCWQTSNLGGATGAGPAIIAEKVAGAGKCATSYDS